MDTIDLMLVCKWGCDVASGQSRYKQIEHGNSDVDDNTVFISSLLPIRLQDKSNSKIIWENPRPSSPWFCRTSKFKFIKESNEVTNEEINGIKHEIENSSPLTLNNNIEIGYAMALTMVDNKVCNVITGTSSAMKCYICQT